MKWLSKGLSCGLLPRCMFIFPCLQSTEIATVHIFNYFVHNTSFKNIRQSSWITVKLFFCTAPY